jgi:hypothetical protein
MDIFWLILIGVAVLLVITCIIIIAIKIKAHAERNFDKRVCFAEIITSHDKATFINELEKSIEKAQKTKMYVEIKYTTEISQMGITHNALIIGRIQKEKK